MIDWLAFPLDKSIICLITFHFTAIFIRIEWMVEGLLLNVEVLKNQDKNGLSEETKYFSKSSSNIYLS